MRVHTWLKDFDWSVVTQQNGHIVAGVSSDEEEQAFRDFCKSLDARA